MKLKNKKTGEIPDKIETIAYVQWSKKMRMVYINNDGERILKQYDSLETFNEEWEDVPEESRVYYYISDFGVIRECEIGKFPEDERDRKQIGNYFEIKKEAEKALEKYQAWVQLEDKGFEFDGIGNDGHGMIYAKTNLHVTDFNALENPGLESRVNLLFGGNE